MREAGLTAALKPGITKVLRQEGWSSQGDPGRQGTGRDPVSSRPAVPLPAMSSWVPEITAYAVSPRPGATLQVKTGSGTSEAVPRAITASLFCRAESPKLDCEHSQRAPRVPEGHPLPRNAPVVLHSFHSSRHRCREPGSVLEAAVASRLPETRWGWRAPWPLGLRLAGQVVLGHFPCGRERVVWSSRSGDRPP